MFFSQIVNFQNSSNHQIYFLFVRVHLPNLDQKLVENQQSFQPVLRGLLDEGCFLVLLQIF